MKQLLHELGEALANFATGLIPAAIGAAVSLAYEKGITWSQRCVQMVVGVVVSYFVTGLVAEFWPMQPFMQQAVGFVVGMIAYKAVPRFTDGVAEALHALPGKIVDAVPFRRKGAGK